MPADVTVYDKSGQVQSLEWAQLKYGPFVIYPAPTPADGQALAWKLTALREKNDSTFIAHAASEAGKPVPGTRICWYWPDAPRLDDAGPMEAPYEGIAANRAVSGFANVNGDVGFAMGPGAHYFAANGERGPHAAWMHGDNTRSDVLLGIGMIPDDHLHLDATWALVTIGSDDDTGEAPELAEALAALSTQLTGLAHAMQVLADALSAYSQTGLESYANG
jgi:hypothetical protein